METADQQIVVAARALLAAADSKSNTTTLKLHELKLAVAAAIGVDSAVVATEL